MAAAATPTRWKVQLLSLEPHRAGSHFWPVAFYCFLLLFWSLHYFEPTEERERESGEKVGERERERDNNFKGDTCASSSLAFCLWLGRFSGAQVAGALAKCAQKWPKARTSDQESRSAFGAKQEQSQRRLVVVVGQPWLSLARSLAPSFLPASLSLSLSSSSFFFCPRAQNALSQVRAGVRTH